MVPDMVPAQPPAISRRLEKNFEEIYPAHDPHAGTLCRIRCVGGDSARCWSVVTLVHVGKEVSKTMSETQVFADAVIDPLDLEFFEVTGTRSVEVDGIDGHRTALDLARSAASLLELPASQPYSLRDEDSQRMLLDEFPVGSQVGKTTKPRLTVIPKAHLG